MKIVYVILHYLAGEDTRECAQSILEATKDSCHDTHVVIVDNSSPNDSYSLLTQAFAADPRVTLLQSKKNLGFARGNNLGFAYAKEQLQADFIITLNNDTVLSQKDFNEILVEKYRQTGYGVLGPDIVTADGLHQNPGSKQSWSFHELRMLRLKRRVWNLLNILRITSAAAKAAARNDYPAQPLTEDVAHTILHGACWVFSPLYIKRFSGICADTFLYMEEDILKLQADLYGFTMRYSSDLRIYHKEDVSSNMLAGTTDKKARRKNRFVIQSSQVYSKLKHTILRKKRFFGILNKVAGQAKKTGYQIDPDVPVSYMLSTAIERAFMLVRGIMRMPGTKIFIGKNVTLRCKKKMTLGKGVTLQRNTYIDALSRNGLSLGDGCSIGSGTIIRCSGSLQNLGVGFTMGKRSSLADNCFVGATGGVWIGEDVIGGQNIRFHASNHNYQDESVPIRTQGITAKGIHVGNNCWIGAGVVFCDGVTVGNGCVIAANSVVTKSFPDNCVIGGVPAKMIRENRCEKIGENKL